MKRTRVVAIILSLLCCSALFSACGKNENYLSDVNENLHGYNASFNVVYGKNVELHVETSVGDFVIENYGFERFISANLTDYRREYLEFLGINRAFNVPFDLSWLDGAEYSLAQNAYPLVIGTPNAFIISLPFPLRATPRVL